MEADRCSRPLPNTRFRLHDEAAHDAGGADVDGRRQAGVERSGSKFIPEFKNPKVAVWNLPNDPQGAWANSLARTAR
jgi:hypothetical protein